MSNCETLSSSKLSEWKLTNCDTSRNRTGDVSNRKQEKMKGGLLTRNLWQEFTQRNYLLASKKTH